MAKFILNDETKINTYGFKVKTAGIDLSRFTGNPVMLNQHENHTNAVIGRWINTRVEGANLVAETEFDINDPAANLLAGKVERGFIKGASIGIRFNEDDMVSLTDGTFELIKCTLVECSICAVPSNPNAISLYSNDGNLLNETQIKLSLLNLNVKPINKNNMDLLQEILKLLKLPTDTSNEDALKAIEELINQKDAALEVQAKEIVQMALNDGRITASQKDFYIDAAKRNFKSTLSALTALNPKVSLQAMLSKKSISAERSNWTLDEWRKNDPMHLQANPDFYKKLIEEENTK
jgi:HK97 family phage prohead protease